MTAGRTAAKEDEGPRLPLCFVLMPFGRKPDPASSRTLDFDAIYRNVIHPAIEEAGLEPIRADEEQAGGIIHKPMFERLILCDYAVADLTTANANVFYELGVRHAVRPWSTVMIFAEGARLPFDVSPFRAMPYKVSAAGKPSDARSARTTLAELLRAAREAVTDSPVFQLVDDLRPPDVAHLKTDVFRDRVAYSRQVKEKLADARRDDAQAVRDVMQTLGPIEDIESGVLIDLMLSFRAVKAWPDLIDLVERMPEPIARTVMVREQYALALNRAGHDERAERVLLELVEERGPSSETYGILGRVYKDRWEVAGKEGQRARASGMLRKAIDAYLKGFEADSRDAYPGVNAVTMMELSNPPDPRQQELLPVVTYAVKRRVATGEPDYWDHATLLELAVLRKDEAAARVSLDDALAAVREVWEPETTLRNLRLIREARQGRKEKVPNWLSDVENALASAAAGEDS